MTAQSALPTRAPHAKGPDPLSFIEQITQSQRRIATYQRRVSEHAVAPNEHKVLRRFSLAEACDLLPFSQDKLSTLLEADLSAPQGEKSAFGRRTFSIDEIHQLRNYINEKNLGSCRRHRDSARGESIQVLLVNNFKGGVGKSSTAIMMSHWLALAGYRVLALDLDPQGSLTTMFGIYPELHVQPGESIYAALRREDTSRGVMRRPLAELIRHTHIPNLHMVPAHIELTDYEFDAPLAFHLGNQGVGEGIGIMLSLARAIESVEDEYDIVIVDTPPSLGYTTLTALFATTGIVTPLQAQMLDVASLEQFLAMVADYMQTISDGMGVKPPILWQRYLITMFQDNRGQATVLSHLRSLLGDSVLENVMVASSAVTDASAVHSSIFEITPEASMRRQYDRALTSARAILNDIEKDILATWNRSTEFTA